ncbi:restriction endonuclease [Streptomyces xanthochromogenes]|uniref:restriction endonuclease n=1 Tax=Streptomyces xanthochromogenes TaxID=67384 RepID=UPI00343FA180
MNGFTSMYGVFEAELPLDRRMHEQLARAVLAWNTVEPLAPDDYAQVALLLTGAARAAACDVQRCAELLPDADGKRLLAELVLADADAELSWPLRGTLCCAQERARLVRGLYWRLDRLSETVVPAAAAPPTP